MGNTNIPRRRRVVEVVERQAVITAVVVEGDEDETYMFEDEDKKKLVSDLAREFPYITFSINTTTNYLEWGINRGRSDYGEYIYYDHRQHTLNLDGEVSREILSYEHILGKVRIIILDTTEAKTLLLLEEMKKQKEAVEDKVKEYLEPIQEKMQAIFNLLDSVPGSQGFLEARTHFQARRQSM